MKAIQVKYLSATTHRGARYKAFAEGWGSYIKPREYALDSVDDARKAAYELFRRECKWNQNYELIDGSLPNGDHVFCLRGVLND